MERGIKGEVGIEIWGIEKIRCHKIARTVTLPEYAENPPEAEFKAHNKGKED